MLLPRTAQRNDRSLCPLRVQTGKAQCEHMFSALHHSKADKRFQGKRPKLYWLRAAAVRAKPNPLKHRSGYFAKSTTFKRRANDLPDMCAPLCESFSSFSKEIVALIDGCNA